MSEKNESSVSVIVGFWTGVAIWVVIMTAFKWWWVWWAYFPLIGVISGAIQKTANYLHNRNNPPSPKSIESPSQSQISAEMSTISKDPDQNHSPVMKKHCPGCGGKIEEENLKFCSTCGYELD